MPYKRKYKQGGLILNMYQLAFIFETEDFVWWRNKIMHKHFIRHWSFARLEIEIKYRRLYTAVKI
jgi:hypothetical protein